MPVGIGVHGCSCLRSRRSVNVCVCTATHALTIKKGRSSGLVIRVRATLIGRRHACTSVCNGSQRKVLTVTKETGPVGRGM